MSAGTSNASFGALESDYNSYGVMDVLEWPFHKV